MKPLLRKEWCYKVGVIGVKNNVELFILEDELQPKGDGTYKVPGNDGMPWKY